MDELSHNIKTKSLTAALDALTEQVVEVSSLTIQDLNSQKYIRQSFEHLSDGIQKSSKYFCDCLARKLKSINPAVNTIDMFQEMLKIAEDISTNCLKMTFEETSWEAFKENIACLLEAVLKLLVLWDQEIVIGLRKLINNLRRNVFQMRKASTTQELVFLYQRFAENLVMFSTPFQLRMEDMIDNKVQSEFFIHFKCIQKLSKSLAEIIKNFASHPLSKHSKVSKDFITKEILSLLDEVEDLLTLEKPNDKLNEGASFLTAIDEILAKLDRGHFDREEIDIKIESILQHSMTVSKFSAEEDKEQIIRYSHRVFNEYKCLQEMLNNLEQSPGDISLAVDILRDFLELLEQAVNHSLLRMMVENLSMCTEPIRRLIQRCPLDPGESVSNRTTADLATDVHAFDTVMERVLQTCSFALASTEDVLKMQIIRCALKLLESLEAEMIPAVYSCFLDPNDKAAACHLQFLWCSFLEQCEHVQASLDSIADPIAFCHVSEKVMTEHIYALRKNLYAQNASLLETHTRPITAIATRCLALLKNQKWEKSVYEKLSLKEVKIALKEFNGAVLLTMDNLSDLRSHRSLLKRAELVLKYLMKSIDSLRRLQDSNLLSSFSESHGSSINRQRDFVEFPESIRDLPLDPTRNDHTHPSLSRSSLIGRIPSRKLQKTIHYARTCNNFSEMEKFVDVTKPWRLRTSTLSRSGKSVEHSNAPVSRENFSSVSFDLTAILEELSVSESTLSSTDTNASSAFLKNNQLPEKEGNFKSSVSSLDSQTQFSSQVLMSALSTPSRLRRLRIVSERLASFRDQNSIEK